MKMNNIVTLQVDEEFVSLIPPLQKEEFEQLRDNILKSKKVINPLIVWEGVIIDGHHRFKVICDHPEIAYQVEPITFADRYEAISWICDNQLGRRNLTPIQRTALIGRRYAAEKRTHGAADGFRGNQHTGGISPNDEYTPQSKTENKTAYRIAREMGITHATVERAEKFVQGMDAAEEVLPGIAKEIFNGQIRPTHDQVAAIAKAPQENRLMLAEQLRIPKKMSEQEKADRASRREMMNMIAELSAKHGNMDRPKVGIDSLLQSLSATVNMMMSTCDIYFQEHPEMLTEPKNREQTLEILLRFKRYVTEIEEKYNEHNND